MAISNRPEDHGSRDDRPKITETSTTPESGTSNDADPVRDAETTREMDAGTRIDSDAPTRVDRIRAGATPMTTSGTAAAPAPATSTDDAEATTPISARTGAKKELGPDAQLRAEAIEARRNAAEQLGIARTRNRGTTDVGLLILRLMNVVMFLHGLAKATGYNAFRQTVATNDFGALAPDLFAILIIVGQLALPIAIAVGLLTRLAGLLQAVMMGFIWVMVPLASGLLADNGGIAGESAYLFVAIGLTLAFTGAGRMSIDQVIFATGAERRAVRRAEKKLT
jgi:uncharacterized membrane protein YphA (DoxX/SURF4 family)